MAKSNTKTTKGKGKAHKKKQVSAYEQARLDNIKRNEARLKALGLDDAKKQVRNAARGMLMLIGIINIYGIMLYIITLKHTFNTSYPFHIPINREETFRE